MIKMRRMIIVLFILVFSSLALSLVGCFNDISSSPQSVDLSYSASSELEDNSLLINSKIFPANSFVTSNSIQESEGEYIRINLGKLRIWPSELSRIIDRTNCVDVIPLNDAEKELCIISAREYFSEDSSDFDLLDEREFVFRGPLGDDYVQTKVRYVNYLTDSSASEDELVAVVSEYISNRYGRICSPIIMVESWSFSLYGKEYTVLNSCNYVIEQYDHDILSSLYDFPAEESDHLQDDGYYRYMLSFLLCDNSIKYVLRENVEEISLTTPEYKSQFSFSPNGKTTYATTIQYDEDGNMCRFPVYAERFDNYSFMLPKVILIDLSEDRVLLDCLFEDHTYPAPFKTEEYIISEQAIEKVILTQ